VGFQPITHNQGFVNNYTFHQKPATKASSPAERTSILYPESLPVSQQKPVIAGMHFAEGVSRSNVMRTTNLSSQNARTNLTLTEMQNTYAAQTNKLVRLTPNSNAPTSRVTPGSPRSFNTIQYQSAAKDYIH
jgi:hypothetical protein